MKKDLVVKVACVVVPALLLAVAGMWLLTHVVRQFEENSRVRSEEHTSELQSRI